MGILADSSTTVRVRDSAGDEWRDLVNFPYGEEGNMVEFAGTVSSFKSVLALSTLGRETQALEVSVMSAPGSLLLESILSEDEQCLVLRWLSARHLTLVSQASKRFRILCTSVADAAIIEMRVGDVPVPHLETTFHRLARLCGVRFAPAVFYSAAIRTACDFKTDISIEIAAIEKLHVLVGDQPLVDSYPEDDPGRHFEFGECGTEWMKHAITHTEHSRRKHIKHKDVDAAMQCGELYLRLSGLLPFCSDGEFTREWYKTAADFFQELESDFPWNGAYWLALTREDAIAYAILHGYLDGLQPASFASKMESFASEVAEADPANLPAGKALILAVAERVSTTLQPCANPVCCHQACDCRLANPHDAYAGGRWNGGPPWFHNQERGDYDATALETLGGTCLPCVGGCPSARFLREANRRVRQWIREGTRHPERTLAKIDFKLETGVAKWY
ncbi:hypothetical protein EMIHUDRAFT_455177 [Emiliania huxleyi CCMP1516]|uniref:F-box domain-containing protein n=2 Tax=Emiliania huxleyi TaxID=2903 RepID=A0A0D3KJT8_EMIH1|nr:hypothetical protein EMIHUDRAFT_455177 [Emiliania huxleyi CCMP1516]EOD36023.1 hypothetical protein EMIHUDRAFT_455177 [Emiliania huxleyi CCMP1516]|eukprot:XP_005788452.1 hypothetical protein EMIHUDRAFT_455177 [Emiliania huxleyi CCMP1516]